MMRVRADCSVEEIGNGKRLGPSDRLQNGLYRETLETLFSVRRQKEEKSGMCVGGVWQWVSVVENWLMRIATLSVKLVAKSSAVTISMRGWRSTEQRGECCE